MRLLISPEKCTEPTLEICICLYLFMDYEWSLQTCWKCVNHVYSSHKSNYIQTQNKNGYYKMLLHKPFPPQTIEHWAQSPIFPSFEMSAVKILQMSFHKVLSGRTWRKRREGQKGMHLWLKFGFPMKFFPRSSVGSKGCRDWRWFVRLEAKDLKGYWRGAGAGPTAGIAEGFNMVCMYVACSSVWKSPQMLFNILCTYSTKLRSNLQTGQGTFVPDLAIFTQAKFPLT